MALQTSATEPAPVRQIANLLSQYIDRLGAVWIEGQVTQIGRRQGMATVFLTLRDTVADISLSLTAPRQVIDSLRTPLIEGASVVVQAKPDFYANRGTLSLRVLHLQMIGLGELLARIEQRRQLLAAEGLFDEARKQPLPFLPHAVGLITAHNSAAERDVLDHAQAQWPGVRFEVRYAAMQGANAVAEICGALQRLDADPTVEVIVIARGGGSVEDLLPFSDETLVRAVASARTPVVSAIGHQPDWPLVDYAADVRASTPTHAAKLVVPDFAAESDGVAAARQRARALLDRLLQQQRHDLDAVRARPVLAQPLRGFEQRHADVVQLRERGQRALRLNLHRERDQVRQLASRSQALSPLATLRRGYAVLLDQEGRIVTEADLTAPGQRLRARLAQGSLDLVVEQPSPDKQEEL